LRGALPATSRDDGRVTIEPAAISLNPRLPAADEAERR
jgi:hypothetical protein